MNMTTSNKQLIDQYTHFKVALMRDFQEQLWNNDYIEPELHLDVLNTLEKLSTEIRRLELNENQ